MGKIIFFLLLFTNISFAEEEFFLRYSVNANPKAGSLSSLKSLSVGFTKKYNYLIRKYEIGVLASDSTMMFGQIGIGIEPVSNNFYMHFYQSVGVVSGEDKFLSGYFQFFEDFGFGIKDKNHTAIGFSFKHISNAGLSSPNRGRDMLGLQIRIPL